MAEWGQTHYYNETYTSVPDHAEGWKVAGENVTGGIINITPDDRWASENVSRLHADWLPAHVNTVNLSYGNSTTVAPVSVQVLFIVKY